MIDVRSIDTDTYGKYINHHTVFDIYAMYDVCTNWIVPVSIVCVLYKCILLSTSWGPMKNWKMMVSKRKFSEQPKKLPVFGEDSCSSWSGEFPGYGLHIEEVIQRQALQSDKKGLPPY